MHSHPHEQITIVERGRVRFTIDGQERIASAGDVLHFPRGVRHGATMLDEEVVLIDIFSPVREDFLPGGTDAGSRDVDSTCSASTARWRWSPAPRAVLAQRWRWRSPAAGADVVLHASERAAGADRRTIADADAGRKTCAVTADLADRESAERIVARALAAFGQLDIVVNNAGIIRREPAAAEHSDEDWDDGARQ